MGALSFQRGHGYCNEAIINPNTMRHQSRAVILSSAALQHKSSGFIGEGLEAVLRNDACNKNAADQHFCIAMEARAGWRTLLLVTNEASEDVSVTTMDYCNLPIRCRFYLSIDHLVKECRGTRLQRHTEEEVAISVRIPPPAPTARKVPYPQHDTPTTNDKAAPVKDNLDKKGKEAHPCNSLAQAKERRYIQCTSHSHTSSIPFNSRNMLPPSVHLFDMYPSSFAND
uniref:Uncharacterized protein n=1 Tax=Physcomitrium patens TaxID=3218 RepID=A0A2K1JGC8_PHYPA|nr:hypothetical protein PHYPA_018015 [Physcomitrium patens]